MRPKSLDKIAIRNTVAWPSTAKSALAMWYAWLLTMSVVIQNSKFFQMFDVDGDGLISYSEYLLLITFLSIPVEVSLQTVLNYSHWID